MKHIALKQDANGNIGVLSEQRSLRLKKSIMALYEKIKNFDDSL